MAVGHKKYTIYNCIVEPALRWYVNVTKKNKNHSFMKRFICFFALFSYEITSFFRKHDTVVSLLSNKESRNLFSHASIYVEQMVLLLTTAKLRPTPKIRPL